MPAPLPPDQSTIVRSLISKGDIAGAIKVYAEATGATQSEAETEVNRLAARYGMVGSQLPDLFVRRTPPAPAPAAEAPAPAAPAPTPVPPPPPAPTAPVSPLPAATPAPAPVPAPTVAATPTPPPKPAPAVAASAAPQSGPASTPQPAPTSTTPSTQKSSRWGCSSVFAFFLVAGGAALTWWVTR